MDKDNNCIGLALSGGGYRAAAYHLGTLRALYKLGLLNKIDTISSVSGGSIVSAYYLLHLGDFKNFDERFYKKLGCGVMHLAFLDILLVLGIFAALGFLVSPWLSLLIIPSFWFFCYKMFPLSWLVELQYRWLFSVTKLCQIYQINHLLSSIQQMWLRGVCSSSPKIGRGDIITRIE